ncbi:TPA: hypothetical protein N0F65_005593 [Lagenidium giganteum]|uniref:Reverse transcriptase Ty1/copia-type domain-containing protein n=1 Tax=Lagenidium giganteum TaxID=4803 RepID=A0AAV2Z7D7_9STRA|nr:TPA: hypothetical protein N0F65_005593 [Lagenidium giganteum]
MTTAKVIFTFAIIWCVTASHFDVPSAYLNANQDDGFTIHLSIPDGMDFTRENWNYRTRLWSKLLHTKRVQLGFTPCVTGPCLYFKRDAHGTTLVGVYVDDLLVTATRQIACKNCSRPWQT